MAGDEYTMTFLWNAVLPTDLVRSMWGISLVGTTLVNNVVFTFNRQRKIYFLFTTYF